MNIKKYNNKILETKVCPEVALTETPLAPSPPDAPPRGPSPVRPDRPGVRLFLQARPGRLARKEDRPLPPLLHLRLHPVGQRIVGVGHVVVVRGDDDPGGARIGYQGGCPRQEGEGAAAHLRTSHAADAKAEPQTSTSRPWIGWSPLVETIENLIPTFYYY